MPKIFINRNRQNLGQFTEEEVAEGLRTGRFLPTDLAWQEPMETWKPLSAFENLSRIPVGAPAELPADSGAATGDFPGVPEAPAMVEPAWERDRKNPAQAIFETVRDVFSKPADVFRAMPVTGGFGRPLSFYVLLSWLTGSVTLLYQAAITYVNPTMTLGEKAKEVSPEMLIGIFIGTIVVLPVLLLIGAFISSGIMHVALMLVGGAKNGYEATFRALAYSSASTSILQVLPLCGSWIYAIASLIYSVIALKEAHRTEIWRPVVAVVIVVLVCCGLAVLTVGGIGAAAAAAAHVAR